MQTCIPLKARQWFKFRTPVNWVVSIIVFVPLVFLLQHILPFLIADTIALAAVFCLFFFYLHKRAIAIECPHCHNYIETNTPWICGNVDKHCRNDQVDDFPFIHRCQHCGFIPKAYQCHHCGKLIFLSQDKQTAGFAKCADIPVKSKSDKPDPTVGKAAKQNAEKNDLLHELEVTKIKGEIKKEKSNLEPPKMKSLEDKYREMVKDDDDARKLESAIEEECKNDPEERAKRLALLKAVLRENS